MTVTGATTAQLASASYTPPFKYVTSNAQQPLVTGTSSVNDNPTVSVSAGSTDIDYVDAYLQAHMMSWPSYRWAYLLWMVLAAIALIYALAHALRLNRGSLGASFSRWGMRRRPWGRKRGAGSRPRALPSNAVMLVIAIIVAVSCVCCVIGADYIAPSSAILDFKTSFKRDSSYGQPGYTISKSFWTSGSRFGDIAFALIPLVVLFALKAPPIAFLSLRATVHLFADKLALLHRAAAWLVWIFTTIHVALWTVQLFEDSHNGKPVWLVIWKSYRFIFGCVAYGAMTAVMVFSLRPVRKARYEFFYIAHVVFTFLTIVCAAVHHPPLWWWMAAALGLWVAERIVRYVRMTRINGFGSAKSRRVPQTLGGRPYSNVSTSDKEQYGMSELKRNPDFGAEPPYNVDKTLPRPPGLGTPGTMTPDWTPSASSVDLTGQDFGNQSRGSRGYYDEGSLQPLGAYDSRSNDYPRHDGYARDDAGRIDPYANSYSDPYGTPATSTYVSHNDGPYDEGKSTHQRARESIATLQSATTAPALIPVGYAHCQLLPSRTIRLTIKIARPFKWSPGQSVLLYLPDLSRIQSHPFTILNNDGSEIVLLVKARKGLTRKLFDHVRSRNLAAVGITGGDQRLSLAAMQRGKGGLDVPPVLVKAWVDGPMGSSGRARWGDFSSVLIVCGGSGVSFGMAVCDWVCKRISKRESGKLHTERVRFCWVAREYAEIAWVAHHLRSCQAMVPPEQLQIDIFVTNAVKRSKLRDELAPPRPGFAGGNPRSASMDSVRSDVSFSSPDSPVESEETAESSFTSSYSDVVDLTNYEDEEDVNDPAENRLSRALQKQGKVRRANSRRDRVSGLVHSPSGLGISAKAQRAIAKSPSTSAIPANTSIGHRSRLSAAEEAPDAESAYAAAARGSYYDNPPPQPMSRAHESSHTLNHPGGNPLISPNADRRHSYRSLADSTYARYDPFNAPGMGPRGPSPSPSILFDDNQSAYGESVRGLLHPAANRSQSMTLLEDAGADPGGDAALWIDTADYESMLKISEFARVGKPKLGEVLREEVEAAKGPLIVATCGPIALNTVMRNLVSRHISPGRIRNGDKRGQIAIYSEDYES